MAWPRSRIKVALTAALALGVADLGLMIFVLGPAMATSQAARMGDKGQGLDGQGAVAAKPASVEPAPLKPTPVKVAVAPKPVAKPEPVKPEPVKPKPALSDETVRFITGGYGLTQKAKQAVQRVITSMRQHKEVVVVLRGHADQRGDPAANLILSRKRALSISFALRRAGLASKRIVIEAVGDKEPLSRENTPAAWAQNRRVEVRWQRGTK